MENKKFKFTKKTTIMIITLILLIIIATATTIILVTNNQKTNSLEAQNEKSVANAQEAVENNNAKKQQAKEYTEEHVNKIQDASGDTVPVPKGYVGSKVAGENEIDTGYVIYEGEEVVDDTNVAEAKKTRNQYVWVPVYDTSKFYGKDSNGKLWGKIYQFSTSTSSDYDQATGTKPYNWSESNGIMKISSKTSYREPDVVPKSGSTVCDGDSRLKKLGIGAETTQEFLMQLEKEFTNMIKSVEKYGGFYIGRYETGDLKKDVAVVRRMNTDIGSQTWYTMYEKCKKLKGSNKNVQTGMIWGNQYDRTLMWLIESGNKTKEQVIDDSKDWGNYRNTTFEYENNSGSMVTKTDSTRIPTGSSEFTKANNIYDLAGNVLDWTAEAYYTDDRVMRRRLLLRP